MSTTHEPTDPQIHPAASAEHESTLTLPRMERPEVPAPASGRRSAALPAAVLAGALVLGGAAGVGGAATYEALRPAQPTAAGSTTKPSNQLPTAPLGSVEGVAERVLPSVVQINVVSGNGGGTGSGIILTSDGTIVTNNHVVDAASGATITVNFHDGSSATAKVLGKDPVTDVAVIKAEGVSNLPKADIGDSSALRVGQPVVAFGSPFGLEATVTTGIVSALNRAVSVATTNSDSGGPFGNSSPPSSTTYPAIQTDAAINPGNSGGPLVNMAGQVIGINSSIRTAGTSGGQGGSIGLGFAIPINPIMPIVDQLQTGKPASHARLGISVTNNSEGNQLAPGAVVKTVETGSAAEKAGLLVGDVITKVDDVFVGSSDALVATVRSFRPGDTVKVTFTRAGTTKTVTATLGSDATTTS